MGMRILSLEATVKCFMYELFSETFKKNHIVDFSNKMLVLYPISYKKTIKLNTFRLPKRISQSWSFNVFLNFFAINHLF